MMVSDGRSRRGHSSVRNTAVATATGTPITRAIVAEISVPTTSGSAPKMSFETSQLLLKVNPKTPNFDSAGWASTISRMKKKAIRTRIPPASPVSPQRSALSGRRACSGRSREERPPRAIEVVVASTAIGRLLAARQGAAVAGQRLRRGLGLREQRVGQLGELQLVEAALALVERVVDERAHRLRV